MTELLDVSRALGGVVAAAEASVVAVHGGRCEAANGTAWGERLVVTSARVLEREQGIEVTTAAGRAPATLVGADPVSGIAVLRVDSELPALHARDSATLRVGELVVALARTERGLGARLGIVSRLGGEWRLPGGARFERYVESDIAPSPGLAGSALLTASGELVGVSSTVLARGALVALPAASVGRIVSALVAHGRVRRARLGIALERVELPRAVAERLGRRRGLVVTSVVEGSAAERGGLLLGDVLLAIGEKPTERVSDLQSALDESAIGVSVSIDILRAGREERLVLAPEARS
jgi:S1-C subfamily serine protease